MLKKTSTLSKPFKAFLLAVASSFVTLSFVTYYQLFENNINPIISICLFVLGVGLWFTLCDGIDEIETDTKKNLIVLTFASTILGIISPFPFFLSFIMILIVNILRFINYKKTYIYFKLLVLSKLIAVSGILFILSYFFTVKLRSNATPIFSYLIKALSQLTGMQANTDGSYLLLKTPEGITHFSLSYEMFGTFIFASFLILFLYSICKMFRPSTKYYILSTIITLLYMIFRYIVLINIYTLYDKQVNLFFGYIEILLSMIPLMILLTYPLYNFLSVKGNRELKLSKLTLKKIMVNAFCVVIGITLLTGYYGDFHSKEKDSTIYVDEYHSPNWESCKEPLDKNNYGGQKSTYTYTSLVSFLGNFAPVQLIESLDQYNDLTSDDILILKTPTKAFDYEIQEKINKFVEDGGSLFMIGDHTNLLNMSKHLNEIAKRYGFKFNYDATYDTKTTGLSVFKRNYPFFQSGITREVPYYHFATSCSISSSFGIRSVMIGNALTSEQMDLSTPHYFNNMTPEAKDNFGPFEQCISLRKGKGKIIAFSDSTTFSSFSVFMHKNPEFITSIILDLKSHSNIVNNVLLTIGAILLLIFIVLLFKYKDLKLELDLLLSLVCIIVIGNFFLEVNNQSFSETVSSKLNSIQQIWVVHDQNNKISHFVGMGQSHNDYSSMFIAFQRLQYFVREKSNLKELNDVKPEAVVIMEPFKLSRNEEERLINYLQNGGKLIYLDREDLDNVNDFNRIFHGYANMHRFYSEYEMQSSSDEKKILINKWTKFINANDMKTIYDEIYANISASKFSIDKGYVTVIYDINSFSNYFMGDPGLPPTQKQIDRHNSFYKLVEFALSS